MAEVLEEKTSLLDSALGPVLVTTSTIRGLDIDDFVQSAVIGKAEYLRVLNKASQVNPLEAKGKPVVRLGGYVLGGYDAI